MRADWYCEAERVSSLGREASIFAISGRSRVQAAGFRGSRFPGCGFSFNNFSGSFL
jgi:hypothetical protein